MKSLFMICSQVWDQKTFKTHLARFTKRSTLPGFHTSFHLTVACRFSSKYMIYVPSIRSSPRHGSLKALVTMVLDADFEVVLDLHIGVASVTE